MEFSEKTRSSRQSSFYERVQSYLCRIVIITARNRLSLKERQGIAAIDLFTRHSWQRIDHGD